MTSQIKAQGNGRDFYPLDSTMAFAARLKRNAPPDVIFDFVKVFP